MPHRKMLAPINTVKHYVHRSNSGVASGSISSNVIVDAVVAPATGNAFDVKESAVIKAVHIEFWLLMVGASGSTSQFAMIIEKVPSNQASVTVAQMLNLGAYTNKKNILYTTQGVLGSFIDGSPSIPIIKSWFLIPKGKQRFGLGDRLVVSMAPTGQTTNICGLSTYKEYI